MKCLQEAPWSQMRFLRKLKAKSMKGKTGNDVFKEKFQIKPMRVKLGERQLGWLGCLNKMLDGRFIRGE